MTEKESKNMRSRSIYRLFWADAFGLVILCLLRTIISALYSFYVLVKITGEQGFAVLNNETRDALLAQYGSWYFPFSWTSMISLFFIVMITIAFWNLSTYVVAQFVLPVTSLGDRKKARDRFNLFISGGHGAAIFVKEGKLIERQKETENTKPGVILVDLSSAVVLAQQEKTQSWNLAGQDAEKADGFNQLLMQHKEGKKNIPFVETRGPGLVFTNRGQKIFSVLDLRRQSRSKDNVEACTRNGIKISTRVSVTFSLSDEPEIIPVGYIRLAGVTELRWISLEESPNRGIVSIKQSFPLDSSDILEITDYLRGVPGDHAEPQFAETSVSTPYKFYERRVFDAAFSRARSVMTGDFVPWYDAPLEIAVDIFRKELLSIPYDDLYSDLDVSKNDDSKSNTKEVTTHRSNSAIKKLKDDFTRKVKMKGIVLFQILERRDHLPFREGEVIRLDLITRRSPISLSRHKFNSLRSVGVVVKSASFGDIQPVNTDIKKELLKKWKAKWQKEIDFINAEYDLEAVRIRNRARAQIQQEMTYLLSSIFQSSHTDEALALRVFQALESAATNPTANSDISPKEIVAMLESLHKWLLIDRKDALQKGPNGKHEVK